jgi:hypothetical protein
LDNNGSSVSVSISANFTTPAISPSCCSEGKWGFAYTLRCIAGSYSSSISSVALI